jgi:hypothetical protein
MQYAREAQGQHLRMLGPDPYQPPHNPYDYDPHLGGGYPGDRAPPPDLTDVAQILGLGPMDGDTEATHQTLNHPWGKVVKLHGDGKSITLVDTEAYPRPFPWAIQARFSLDGKTYHPTVPGTWGGDVVFKFTKSFDVKTGPATEIVDLVANDQMPICALIARKLTVSVEIIGESVLDLFLAFVVCPTQQIDCTELVGPGANPEGFNQTTVARYPANTTKTTQLADANRKYMVITNQAQTDLFVALSDDVDTVAGSEKATIILPGGINAGYEVLNWQGPVTWQYSDGSDSTNGFALVTMGRKA